MKFTIDRTKWLRGEGIDKSYLLRSSDRKMCCVGQMCVQLRVPAKHILNKSSIVQIKESALPKKLIDQDGDTVDWVRDAYEVNDDESIDDAEREKELTRILNENGHEIEFVG